jgi:translocation protein SEC63
MSWACLRYVHHPALQRLERILTAKQSASEKEIKKRYRRLSLTQHPDKRREDLSNNITADAINDHWVEVTKAFKALTDEEVRNNYLQFGHPDGKQSFSIGIALPKWIVTEGHGTYVLLMYFFPTRSASGGTALSE